MIVLEMMVDLSPLYISLKTAIYYNYHYFLFRFISCKMDIESKT